MEVTIEGLENLGVVLKDLAPKAARTAVRKAGKTAGNIWEEAIVDNIQAAGLVETGTMEESVKVTSSLTEDGISINVGVGKVMYPRRPNSSRDTAMAAHFAEFGTRHEVARPFMRPAFDSHQTDVLDLFTETLNTELQKLAIKE